MKTCDWCNNDLPYNKMKNETGGVELREGTFKFKKFCSQKCKHAYINSKEESNPSSSTSENKSSYLDDKYEQIERQRKMISEERSKNSLEEIKRNSQRSKEIKNAQNTLDEIEAERRRLEKILKRKEEIAKAKKKAQDKERERIREQEREQERELERVRQKKIFKEKNEIYSKKVEAIEYILPEEINDCIEVLAKECKKIDKYEPLNLAKNIASEKKAWLKMDANKEMLKNLTHLLDKVAYKNTKLL